VPSRQTGSSRYIATRTCSSARHPFTVSLFIPYGYARVRSRLFLQTHTFPANNSDNDTRLLSGAAVEISIRESIGVGNAATTSRLHYRNYRFSLVSRKQDPRGRGVREYSGIVARSTLQHVTQEIGNYRFHPPPSLLLLFLPFSLCYYNYIILFTPRHVIEYRI